MSWQSKSSAPPNCYVYGGRYRPSFLNFAQAAYYIARGRHRSLGSDSTYVLKHAPALPIFRGADNIPEEGSFVLVANHYERPRLWMAWPAGWVSHIVQGRTGKDVHWIAIQEWATFSLAGIPISAAITRTVFERAFGAYDILAMPPPSAPTIARAGAMRRAAHIIRTGGVVGLMPEGTVGPTPELVEPPEGVGAFIHLLASTGARILPCGLYEEDSRLVAQFGEPFALVVPPDVPKTNRNLWVRERTMHAIRELLPEPLWGAYRP